MKRLLLLSSIVLISAGISYSATGTPSTLIVKTDANNALLVAGATQVAPVTQGVFASRRLATDASGNLLVVLSGGAAPTDATYITQTPNASLTNEQALSTLASGIMRVATTTGVVTSLTDSAGIAANISDETGTGVLVFNDSPTFTTLATFAKIAITQGTITDPAFNINATVTWNDAADTFVGWLFNVTNTNSAAGSLIADWQLNSISLFNIGKTIITSSLPFIGPSGSTSSGTYGFGNGNTSMYSPAGGDLAFSANGNAQFGISNSTGSLRVSRDWCLGWTDTANSVVGGSAIDTSLCRIAADIIGPTTNEAFGLATKAWVRTAPSSPTACTSPSILVSNGTAAFTVDVGSSCTGITTLVVTMPAVTTRYSCNADNLTNPGTSSPDLTATTTTQITITNYSRTTGLAADWTAGDDISINCTGQ